MLQPVRHLASRMRAQAMVELALIAPLLVGIIVVVVQLALLYLDGLSIISVTRDTTRWIATNPNKTDAEVRAYIQNNLPPNLVYGEFDFGADPAHPGWLSPACPPNTDCTLGRRAGYTQTLELTYRPDHDVFLRGPLRLGFFSSDGLFSLPTYRFSMLVSDSALAPEGTQPPTATPAPTRTPIPSTATSTPTLLPGQPTNTSTPVPTSIATTPPTPVPFVGFPVQIASDEGALFDGSVATFTSPRSGPFTATITWSDPAGQTTGTVVTDSPGHYHVTGAHTFAEAGTFGVGVSISDGTNTVTPSSTAVIRDVALSATGTDFNATALYAFSGTVATFTDVNPSAVASDFAATTIDWGDGTPSSFATLTQLAASQGSAFKVTGTHTYAAGGTYTLLIKVQDFGSSTSSANTTAHVAAGPVVVTPVSSIGGTEGALSQALLATFTAADGGPFSATVNWGDGTTSSPADGNAVAIASDNNGGYTVRGAHAYVESGRYDPVTISVTYKTEYTTSATTHADIGGAALHATVNAISATAGQPSSPSQVATFTDDNSLSSGRDLSASVDWGDGTSSPATISGSSVTGGSHTYPVTGADARTYTLTVTIVDAGDTSTSATSTATVAPPPFIVSAGAEIDSMEGAQFTQSVATFLVPQAGADAGQPLSTFSASINWGDNSSSPGTVVQTGTDTYRVDGTHTFAEETCYWASWTNTRYSCFASDQVTVTVADTRGSTGASTLNAYVDDAALDVPTTTFTVAANKPFTLPLFTDENPNAQLTDYQFAYWYSFPGGASYFFGEYFTGGSYGTGTLTRDSDHPGAFLLHSGDFTYPSAGTYTLQLYVADAGWRNISQSYSIEVTSDSRLSYVSPSISFISILPVEGEPWSGRVAEFTSTDSSVLASDLTATIDWGDWSNPTTTQGTVSGDAATGFIVSGGYTYPYAGQYSLTVTLTHASTGWTATGYPVADVSDAPLSGKGDTSFGATATVPFSTTVADFSDANPQAPTWEFSTWSSTINWGDGAATGVDGFSADGSGGYLVAGSHTYASEGTYSVVAHVVDVYGSTVDITSVARVGNAPTPTTTPVPTDTPTPTPTSLPTPTDTPTLVPTPTSTLPPTPALPPTPTDTPGPTPSDTPPATVTPTATLTPTLTPVPPPTNTRIPGATDTPTPIPTDTPVPATSTPTIRPTRTPVPIGTMDGR